MKRKTIPTKQLVRYHFDGIEVVGADIFAGCPRTISKVKATLAERLPKGKRIVCTIRDSAGAQFKIV